MNDNELLGFANKALSDMSVDELNTLFGLTTEDSLSIEDLQLVRKSGDLTAGDIVKIEGSIKLSRAREIWLEIEKRNNEDPDALKSGAMSW